MKPKVTKRTKLTALAHHLNDLAVLIQAKQSLTRRQTDLVVAILARVAAGEDLREDMATAILGAPPSELSVWATIDLFDHPDYPKRAKQAIAEVAARWGLESETLRGYARTRAADAKSITTTSKGDPGFRKVIEIHRDRLVKN